MTILIEPLRPELIRSVVLLHRASMPYTLNVQLGEKHLHDLYVALLVDLGSAVFVATDQGLTIGVVSIVIAPNAVRTRMLASTSLLRKVVLGLRLLCSPKAWMDFAESESMAQPVLIHGTPIEPCLTAICVADSYRGKGVGAALVEEVEKFLRSHGHRRYRLDTRADNQGSREFYKRLGFMEVETRGRNIILAKDILDDSGNS